LLITGANGHLQFGLVSVHGATGAAKELGELPIPAQYGLPEGAPNEISTALEHAYRGVLSDLATNAPLVATFADALVRHRLRDVVQRGA
jgi:hypothetical protein